MREREKARIANSVKLKMKIYLSSFFLLIHSVETVKAYENLRKEINKIETKWVKYCNRNELSKSFIPYLRNEFEIAETIIILDDIYGAKGYTVILRSLAHLRPEERAIQIIINNDYELC